MRRSGKHDSGSADPPPPPTSALPSADRVLGILLGGALAEGVARMRALAAMEGAAQTGAAAEAPPRRLSLPGTLISIGPRTQLSLFVAEGTIRLAAQAATDNDSGALRRRVASGALLRFSLTQGGRPERLDGEPGALVLDRRLHAQRGTPRGHVAALVRLAAIDEPHAALGRHGDDRDAHDDDRLAALADDDSWARGVLFRAAPWGIVARNAAVAFAWAAGDAKLTHADEHASAAGAVAAIVFGLSRGQVLADVLDTTCQRLVQEPSNAPVIAAIARARLRTREPDPVPPRGVRLVDALEQALLAMLTVIPNHARSVAHALWAVSAPHPLALDVATLTGTLLGAQRGAAALPEAWLGDLELLDVLTRQATDLRDAAHRLGEAS